MIKDGKIMDLFEIQSELRVLVDNVTSLYWYIQWHIDAQEEQEAIKKAAQEGGQESQ